MPKNDMELLDPLDPLGNPLNMTKPRHRVHQDGDWHRTVQVWLINFHGDLLLQKRSAQKESFPDLWDISAAGHVKAGQTGIEAALQEAREELGITLEQKDLKFLFCMKGRAVARNGHCIDNEMSDVYLVKKDILPSEIDFQTEEISAVKFISTVALKNILTSQPQNFVPHDEEYQKLFKIIEAGG